MSPTGLRRPSPSIPRPFTPLQLGEPSGCKLGWLFSSRRPPRPWFPGPLLCRDQFPEPCVLSILRSKPPKQGAGFPDRVQPHIHVLPPQCKPGKPRRHRPSPLSVRGQLLTRRVLPQFHKWTGAAGRCGPWLHVTLRRASLWGRLPG